MVAVTLTTIHVGSARRVVTLGLDGKDRAQDFLTALLDGNTLGSEFLKTRIKAVAEHDRYENEYTFRHVGDGIHEFKRPGLRLYAFYDELPGLKPQLIIACHGGTKNTRKEQNADIAKAKALKNRYLQAKAFPGVKITLKILEHEN